MKKMVCCTLVSAVLGISLSCHAADMPGKGVKVQPARATWTTGFFNEALVREGLEELGYKVKKPVDLSVPIFYKSVTLGDVDYWANGWFPIHDPQTPKNFEEKAERIGHVIKAGGLQGYLVSKKYAEEFGMTSLDDFKRPEVREAFDKDGDGKADLVACPPGWGCFDVINYHMKEYGYEDIIKPIQASYEASMAGAIAEHKTGEPIFYYTWAPNWTLSKLKPGVDTVWISVPETRPMEDQKSAVDLMEVTGVEGSLTEVLKTGFVVSDVRIVANKKFAADNPAAKKFFELFRIPLADVNEQNTKMADGEKSPKDVKRHAKEWIKANQVEWDGWIDEAKKAL